MKANNNNERGINEHSFILRIILFLFPLTIFHSHHTQLLLANTCPFSSSYNRVHNLIYTKDKEFVREETPLELLIYTGLLLVLED